MQHQVQDAFDAYSRRDSTPAWSPVDAALEFQPGQWLMVDSVAYPYAVLRRLDVDGETVYRAVRWARRSEDRELIGYYRTLEAACSRAHGDFLRRHSPKGGIYESPQQTVWPE